MSDFKWNDIARMVDLMVGNTMAVGNEAVDKTTEQNLMKLIEVINWQFDNIADSAAARHCYQSSMRRVGERAYSAMAEWKDWLEEKLREYA